MGWYLHYLGGLSMCSSRRRRFLFVAVKGAYLLVTDACADVTIDLIFSCGNLLTLDAIATGGHNCSLMIPRILKIFKFIGSMYLIVKGPAC